MNNAIEFVELARKLSRILDRIYNMYLPNITIAKYRAKDKSNTYQKKTTIRVTQMSLLEALNDLSWYTSQEDHVSEEGVPQVVLARYLGVDTATMCRNVNLLIDGIIEPWVIVKQYNKKVKLISISPKGREILALAKEALSKVNEDTLKRVQKEEITKHVNLKDMCEQLQLLGSLLTPLIIEKKIKKSKSKNKK
ncbi:hypothetical protein IJT10_03740 [bacterium]|nr:hypothetical protein [bacterium]